ncbi:quinohemoprotein amine dehydrogenase subunit beta [Brachymonas denitrificans]|uniref:quinohemoprotein amine dehydrogenase subunit beta n=1 Tax=Brachymonas denitrificans TaxID=28220 RepID=UPI002B002819|nr:quinohemoprotein amine dehydrogenase subunit beta [Brachymonas denitrificans]
MKLTTTLAGASLAICSPLVLASPAQALKPGAEYLVTANFPNNMSFTDTATDTVVKTCTLPDAFGPGTIQMSPDRSRAYILNNHYGDIYGVEVDTCKTVFHARLSQAPTERAKSMWSIAVSPDGKELYSIVNPTTINRDHYVVEQPRLQVYRTDGGMNAKPVRTFPAPRQTTLMQAGDDGALYVVGPDVYRVNVKTGERTVWVPLRNWTRAGYGQPDVLYIWPQQRAQHALNFLITAPKFKDDKKDLDTATYKYGYVNIDLKTGKKEVKDFAEFTEVYFTGAISPKDPNVMYGVLNHLHKYDIRQQKLLQSADLAHTYYTVTPNTSGSKLYLTGTYNTVAVYDADSLKKLRDVKLPGGDMAASTGQIFKR